MNTSLARRAARNRAGLPSILSLDPFGKLRDEFDQLLSTWFAGNEVAGMPTFSPLLDVNETETGYEVKVDLPGVQPNEINVQLSDNVLTISGERKYEKTEEKDKGKKNGATHVVERFYGTYSRSVVLPGAVKGDKIDANYKDGVLTVALPKAEEAKPCQIPVKG